MDLTVKLKFDTKNRHISLFLAVAGTSCKRKAIAIRNFEHLRVLVRQTFILNKRNRLRGEFLKPNGKLRSF